MVKKVLIISIIRLISLLYSVLGQTFRPGIAVINIISHPSLHGLEGIARPIL
jgi:ABC-type uncharacterized transport system substrate-binding protein